MGVFVSIDCSSYRSSQRTTDNGAVAAADLIANRSAGSTANTASNCRVQSGIICICFNGRQYNC